MAPSKLKIEVKIISVEFHEDKKMLETRFITPTGEIMVTRFLADVPDADGNIFTVDCLRQATEEWKEKATDG